MDVQLLTSAILLLMFSQGTLQGSNEKHLLHYLFKEKFYNVMERPVENESLPLIVKFGMILQQIIDVDEKNQIIYTNIWLQMKWKDTNLQWDPYEFGGIKSLRIPAKEIWRPDILMYNSADEAFDGTYHTNVIVDHQGNTLWVPPGMFKSTCAIDITWFPFDDQKCSLKFGSWTYDGRFIDLYMDNEAGGDTTNFIRNGEWDLTGVPGVKNVKTYQCCPERYIDITYTIHIRRRTLYYGFNIIIPCLLISSMSLLLFMLPPDAGEKISLGVTILLSLMVFLLLVAETMPPTSDALPLIGIYFCCIMIMCSLSVLCTVIVLNYHHRGPETHKLPQWVKRGINGWLAYALRMKRPEMDKRKQTIIQRDRLGDIHMNERTTHTLLPNLLELEEDVHASPAAENGICGVPSLTRDEWMGNVSCDSSSKVTDCSAACVRRYMISILKEIRKVTAKLKREEEDSEIKNEWKFAALVIDRLCFWICLTFTLTSTLTILFSAPHLVA